MLIFSLSITPKIALHSLVANHKDTHSHSDGRTDQLNKAGFSCDCNNQVVESPFLDYSLPAQLVAPVFFSDYQATAFQPFRSATHIIFGLRGPPAIS
jgi:hypothetical protein